MNWLLNRLKERSTWLAIFTLAGLFGMKIEPELREHIINAILAVAAVAAFVFRENIRERSTDLDQASRPASALPPIELQGRAESPARRDADSASQPLDSGADLPVFDAASVQRVRDTGLPPDHRPATEGDDRRATPSDESERSGWNG